MLEIKDVRFSAGENEEKKEIINGVTLTVPDGKLVVITGPNGGGKSTLAKIIVGIEKADLGQIIYNGEDVTDYSVTDRAKAGMAFAFQQPVRFKGINVLDLIRMATGSKLSAAEACEYLSMVGLCARDYIDREVNSSLSGGELKRIEIATVIARKANLSVFDEPEAGIDLWSFKNLIEVFKKMRSEIKGSSIIIISHQERILEIADEIIVINGGKIDRQGSKDEIFPTLTGSREIVSACKKAETGGENA